MDTKAVAQITLNHRATTQGLAGILPAETLKELHKRHFESAPLAWVELTADMLNTHPCDRIQRQATELWMVHRLADSQVQEQILPALSAVAAFQLCADDAERLALWRSLYQPLVLHHRHALSHPLPEPVLPSQRLDAGALRTILTGHYGNRVIELLEKASRLHMVNTAADLPASMRARHSSLIDSVAGATFGDGTVYLVADKIAPKKAAAIFLHEVGEHAGMADMLGKDYGRLVQQFRRLLAKGDAYATWAAMRVPRSTPAAHVPSEQLAYLVEKVATDQQPDPAGIEGHALGKECLSHLRGWLFRTPLMSWLDSIGEADHFNLSAEDIAALARQAVDAQAQSLSTAPLSQTEATAWINNLDPTWLDTLFRSNARQRKMALADSSPEAMAGYLYALQVAGATDMDATLDDHTPALARMAAGEHGEHLTVIAGELLEYAASRVPVNAFRQQMSEGGLSMFRSTSSDGTPTLKVITGNGGNSLLTVRHFKRGQGYVMHEMLDSASVEATLTSWVQPVSVDDFGTELAQFAQVDNTHATGRLAQWRQQAETMVQPMFTTGGDGLACVRGCDVIRLPQPLYEQLSDKPVSIMLENPVIDRPGDQFITGADLTLALGLSRTKEILMCEESAVYTSPSWAELANTSGTTTVAELLQASPSSIAECELPAALVFSNASYRSWFAEAGFDGAVYAASTDGYCAINHVFDPSQIAPYSRFGAVNNNDGMEGVADRFDAYQRAYWDYQTEEAKDITGSANPEAVFESSTKMAEAQDALAETMGSSSFLCIEGLTRGGEQVFLTPSSKHQGHWQITRMAGDGLPLSDTLHSSKEEACSELLQSITPNSLRLHAESGHVLRADGRTANEPHATDSSELELPRNTFVGENATGADLAKLAHAKDMAARKLSAYTIYRETGWFCGVDQQWRYEISDDKAAFKSTRIDRDALKTKVMQDLVYRTAGEGMPEGMVKAVFNEGGINHRAGFGYSEEAALENLVTHVANMGETPFQYATVKNGDQFALGDVLEHEELFAAYPFLRNMAVEFRTDEDDYLGVHIEHRNMIVINATRKEEEALSTLLHEIQHAIQSRENFARGGNTEAQFTHNIQSMLQSLAEESAQELEVWKAENQHLKSAESHASEVSKAALMYQSMKNLMRYANRDAPSGVFRLIRNELEWLYDPIIQRDSERRGIARDLDFKLADMPRRGIKRNAAIRDVAYEAAQLYRSCIPHDLLQKFDSDERTLKGMVNAMTREARKKREALEPLRQLKTNAVAAENLFKQSKHSGSYEIYRVLAGEVEARLTQKRQPLTAAERAGRFPWIDSDVPASDVIVYYRGVKVDLPLVTASMSKDAVAPASTPGRRYVPDYHLERWKEATGLSEEVLERYGRLGELQRGAPEGLMVEAQFVMHGNPLSPVIEHIGDLTNRMSPKHSVEFAYEESKIKIANQLRSLNSRYGFRRDYEETLGRTADYLGIDRQELTENVNAALDAYADAHAQLETFTPAQTLARDAAVALGRREFETAAYLLEELLDRMDSLPAFIRELGGTAGPTSTPEFKEWFGKSEVVDHLGRPLVLYHGTNADFNIFNHDASREDQVLFATPNQKVASDFALYRTTWGGANVMPIFVKADKVLEVEGSYRPIREVETNTQLDGMLPGEDVRAYAKRMGYDAIVFRNTTDDVGPDIAPAADIYALLPSAQIKSAAGNIGTFDPDNDDIRFKRNRSITRIPDFNNWFGDSKVIDPQSGEPLIVQHRGVATARGDALSVLYPGGEPGVEEFPLSGTKLARRASELGLRSGPAIWFTDVGEVPNTGRPATEASVTYPAYLSLKNPLRITTQEQRRELIERYTPYPETRSVPIDDTGRRKSVPFRTDFPYRFDGNQRKQLIRDGYDSIILEIPGEQREYIAFESTQIKSAIGNLGIFSPNNPDIRYSRLSATQSSEVNVMDAEAGAGTRIDFDSLPAETKGDVAYALVEHKDGAHVSAQFLEHYGTSPSEDDALADLTGLADPLMLPRITVNPAELANLSARTTSEVAVADYRTRMEAGEVPPPIIVRREGGELVLVEGGHRATAALSAGMTVPAVDISELYAMDWKSYLQGDKVVRGAPFKSLLEDTPQTDLPAFKNWFGESTVVDDGGQPLPVYHGTTAAFNVFREGEEGIFFAASPDTAAFYANWDKGEPRIVSAYLTIENPLRMTWREWLTGVTNDGFRHALVSNDELQDMGYDGVILTEPDHDDPAASSDTYVVFSPDQIKSATDNNGNFDPNNDDIRFTFAGTASVSHDVGTLAQAQERLDAGDDPEVVRQATGWMLGVDHKWRYEISDADARIKPVMSWDAQRRATRAELTQADDKVARSKQELDDIIRFYGDTPASVSERTAAMPEYLSAQQRLHESKLAVIQVTTRLTRLQERGLRVGDVLQHPTLFAAYPSLADIQLSVQPTELGHGASYIHQRNLIVVDENSVDHLLSVLMHELQHAIQAREGFATGSSESQFVDRDVTVERLADIDRQIEDLLTSNPAFAELVSTRRAMFDRIKATYGQGAGEDRRLNWYEVPTSETTSYQLVLDQVTQFDEYSKLVALETKRQVIARDGLNLSAWQQYRSQAGEVEARNTESRLAMSDDERRQTPPIVTQDTHDLDVIVTFNGELMHSAPLPQNAAIKDMSVARQVDISTPEVKSWFLGSVLTDYEGAPLVLYHGTDAQFSEFTPSSEGLFGPGIYLTASREDAGQYTDEGNVIEAIVHTANPFYTTADYEAGMEFDFDSPAIPFIRELFGEDADEVIKRAANSDSGGFGEEVREALEALGHDSVVVQWPYGGPTHVIPLYPSQVMITSGTGTQHEAAPATGAVTDTPAFNSWFGDSKVVDADGKPLVVYHGTAREFNAFDTTYGAFFTPDEGHAYFHAQMRQEDVLNENPVLTEDDVEPQVIPVHLSFQNPMVLDTDNLPKTAYLGNYEQQIEQAKQQGFDSLIVENSEGGTEYVAFYPEQIKSAIGNNGNFDPDNDDIRFSASTEPNRDEPVALTETPAFRNWFGASKVVLANGQPMPVYHGTTSTNYVPAVRQDGSTSARAELERIAAAHGIEDWTSAPAVLERWVRSGMAERFGVTEQDAIHARELMTMASSTEVAPSRVELGFDVFAMPEGDLELGSHFGTEAQAENFGDSFEFFIRIESPLRLPDLGSWDYLAVMHEARNSGVPISDTEHAAVVEANNRNAALRALLASKGYDGIVYENEAEGAGDSYIVFDPEQIMSASQAPAPAAIFDFSLPDEGNQIRDYKIGDTRISISANGNTGEVEISSVRTPQLKRGKGHARAAMQALIAQADAEGVTLTLGASPLDKRTRLDKLVRFYESLGFSTTGKTVNMLGHPIMGRSPKRLTMGAAPAALSFHKAFAGSKVVDAEGQPLVMYHGTRPGNDIKEFRVPKHDGVYFTPDVTYAEGFTSEISGDDAVAGAIYPVYLDIKNPYVVHADEDSPEWESFVYRGLDRAELEAQGYDGALLYHPEHGLDQVIAFDDKQIISAIGLTGAVVSSQSIHASDRFHLQDSPDIELATHMPVATELRYQRAQALLPVLKTHLDVKFVKDSYGSWIDIQENIWVNGQHGGENVGQVSHGVAFINGELYELDPSAHFYLDSEPFWSPVVQADNEAVAKLYEALTGKRYPIFDAGTGEPEAYDRLIRLKAEKGFLHNDGAFIHSSEYEKWINGPPEKLERESAAAFSEWFADSKIVDAEGKPLMVFHGTGSDFSVFSHDFSGDSTGTGDWGDGFYFSDRPEVASDFALNAHGDSPNVMPVYLSIKNPATNEVMLSDRVQNALQDDMGFESVSDVLQDMGFDGIIWDHKNEGGIEYVVFDATQIKSAIANTGAYSRNNQDIRFSLSDDQLGSAGNMPSSRADRPLRVYHGTGAAFTAFDFDRVGEREPGFFFTSNKAVADSYAGTDGHVIQASLNIRKPYRMSNDERILLQMDAAAFHEGGMKGFIDDLKADGYDGLLIEGDKSGQTEEEQSNQWVPFAADQISITRVSTALDRWVGNSNLYLRSDDEARAGTSASADKAFNPELISEMEVPAYKSREKLIDMPIADFLMLARDGYEEEKAASVKKLLDNGTQFNSLPYLRIDLDGRVDGHEGRHRARALAAQGHTTMPVILHMADLRWSQQVDPQLRDYVSEWPATIQAEVGAINPDLKLPFPVTREQSVQSYVPGSSAPATRAIDRARFSLALDRVDAHLFGTEAVALKEKVAQLLPQVARAYETDADNATELDAELDAAYDRLEEILSGMEEDGPSLGDGGPLDNPMLMDNTDAELSLEPALANIYRELYINAGYQQAMDAEDKAEYIRAQVGDLVEVFGGLAENVTDDQLLDLIKEAHDNAGRNRLQGRVKLEGIGRTLLPTTADNPVQSASSVPFSIRTSDLTLPINALVARHTYARPNSMTPGTADRLPLGSIRVAEYGSDLGERYVDVLAEVTVDSLLLSEPEDDIRSHPTFAQYVEWAREGREAPLIQVNQNERGELISINRRRVLAAKEAGITSLRAWVSPINPVTGDVLKLRDVQAMAPTLAPDLSTGAELRQQPVAPMPSPATKDLAFEAAELLDAVKAAYDSGEFEKVDELSQQIESLFDQMDEPEQNLSAEGYDESAIAPATEYLARAYVASLLHPGAGPDIDLLREAVHDIADSFGGLNDGVTDEHIFLAAQQSYDELKIAGASRTRPRFSPEIESILSGLPAVPSPTGHGMRIADVMFHNATSPMLDHFSEWSKGTHVVNQSGAPKVVFSVDAMTNHVDGENGAFIAGRGSKRFVDFDTAWHEAENNLLIGDDGVAQPYQITPAYLALENPAPGMNGRSTTASFGHMAAALGHETALALIEASGQALPMTQAANGAPYFVPDSHVAIAPILDSPECVRMLIDAGHDGAAYAVANDDGSLRTEYRVFAPEQVLSGCPMAVITTGNAGSGLRFSTNAGLQGQQSTVPTTSDGAVAATTQHSASELPLSLQLHHLGGLRLTGEREAIDQFLVTEVQGAIAATSEAINELEGRLTWLGRSHEGGRHYEKTQQKLNDVRNQYRALQRWSAPTKHNHMPWDKPLGKGLIKALRAVIAIKPGEQVTGKMALFLAATTYGDIQQGINKLAQAGIHGVEYGDDMVSWDKTSLTLANHLTLKDQGERFHIAYHGSPHVFDRFDMSKMGTGEGVQAYGRGMYATETLKVARHYQSLTTTHAVYFEETLYPHIDELVAEVVPRVCAQYPELNVQPTELHQRLGLTPAGHQLEAPLAHYLRMLATNPYHAEDVLPRQSPEVAAILKQVGQGLMRYTTPEHDLMIFPRGGVRGINEIFDADTNAYRLALIELESRLHWFVDASASDDEMKEQFQNYLEDCADTEQHIKAIELIKSKLVEKPGCEFYEGQLRDAEWKLYQSQKVGELIRDFGELSVRRAAPRGSIYMVDIDIVDSRYLHYDERVSAQPEPIVATLNKMVEEVLKEPYRTAVAQLIEEDALASEVYKAMHVHSGTKDAESESAARREDALVQQLDSMGIYGIKYLDGITRDGDGEKSFNYVVFNADRLTILGRTAMTDPSPEDFVPVEAPVNGSEQAERSVSMMRLGY